MAIPASEYTCLTRLRGRGGVQAQTLLQSFAQTFADEFIAQAETRAERLGSSLGVMAAIFYFMPFVITVLVVVGLPLISTIINY
jgi:hypothetical protein